MATPRLVALVTAPESATYASSTMPSILQPAGLITATVVSAKVRLNPSDGYVYDADTWSGWLEGIYGGCLAVCRAAGGEVVSFSAERIECLFQDNSTALIAASEMHHAWRAVIERADDPPFARATITIGIHRGDVMLSTRPYLSPHRLISGYASSLAYRIAGLNGTYNTHMLVSETAKQDDCEFAFESVDDIPIKGTSQPLALFALAREHQDAN